jgi:RNA polymerase sigma-70 factor (ECF subfamily)
MQVAMQILAAETSGSMKADGTDLGEVFQQQKERVFRAAYRITGNSTDAEDVLQTVFLRLAGQDNSPDIRNLPAYLHRAAVNAALDLLRSRKDTTALETNDGQFHGTSATNASRGLELRDWLRQSLARLNPRWAEMFVLRFIEDYSNREIARMMGTSTAVVAVLLHRTRALLRKDYLQQARSTQ